MVDVPRRHVSTWPALTCLTCRRCRAALFALRATATSDPFFRCAVVQQNEDSQPLITLSYTTAVASTVGVTLASKGGLFPSFCCALLCSLSCFLLVAGPCPVPEARGESPSALRGCVPSASALGSGRGVRGPVLQPQVGGLGAGFAVADRAQWLLAVMGRRGGPPGLALGERPWPLMTGESAGPCGVLALSLDVAQRCLCRLISLLYMTCLLRLLEWQDFRFSSKWN